jgi:hypothetical protein
VRRLPKPASVASSSISLEILYGGTWVTGVLAREFLANTVILRESVSKSGYFTRHSVAARQTVIPGRERNLHLCLYCDPHSWVSIVYR